MNQWLLNPSVTLRWARDSVPVEFEPCRPGPLRTVSLSHLYPEVIQ